MSYSIIKNAGTRDCNLGYSLRCRGTGSSRMLAFTGVVPLSVRWGTTPLLGVNKRDALSRTRYQALGGGGGVITTIRSCAPSADVVEALGSVDFLERLRGITTLTTRAVSSKTEGASERVSALLPLARSDGQSQVRFAALGALASQPREALDDTTLAQVLEVCRAILSGDKEPSCRCGAADAIAALGLHDGFKDLVDALGSAEADWMLKLSILAGLGEMQHPDAFELLASVVEPEGVRHEEAHNEPLVYAAAVGALGDLGDERALPIVKRVAEEASDEAVRERAKIAADMLAGQT